MTVNLCSWKDSPDVILYYYAYDSIASFTFENSTPHKFFNRPVICRNNFFRNAISNEKHNTLTISISIYAKWCPKTV